MARKHKLVLRDSDLLALALTDSTKAKALVDIYLKVAHNKPVTNAEWNFAVGLFPELNVARHRGALVRWYKKAGVEAPSEDLLRRTLRAMAERAMGWDKPVEADLIVPPPSLLKPQASAGRPPADHDWSAIEAEIRRRRVLPRWRNAPQKQFLHIIQQWCRRKFGKAPGLRTLQPRDPRAKPRAK
jgi:hypothetical protein